ncbi:MAG: energy transducer TonB, partial [Flavobacteriales bacterium]
NLIYPQEALQNNYEGTVHVAFEYSTLGFVQNVSIDKPSKYDVLNKEALRLGNLLPKAYEPAVNYGKITIAAYSIPIEFKIQKQ